MHPSLETRRQWQEEYQKMPRASFGSWKASSGALASTALPIKADVLSLLSYVPGERQQGGCGDCWVWGSTAMVEVALAAQYGVKDRLSIQFLNSAKTESFACQGGSLSQFAAWYNMQKVLIPWSNANADYRDATVNDYCTQSLVDPAGIGRAPSYALVSMAPSMIDSQVNTQDQMIESIKTALANQKAVGMSYYTDFDSADGFSAFWDKQDESVLWVNAHEGQAWNNSTWGGHMVTVVGYNAEDADPSKHYWIVLNSWGAPANRLNGFFRMPMQMNYKATFTDTDKKNHLCYIFNTLDLVAAPAAPAAPTVQVSLSTQSPIAAQPLTLTAQVTGTPPFSYQWRKNGTPILGANSAQLVLPSLTPSDAGQTYDVVVGNAANSQTSAPLSFSVSGQNLLLNPGMEDTSGWTATSSLGLSPWRIGGTYAPLAHSGQGYAYLGGAKSDGSIDSQCVFTQKVQVPNQTGSLVFSYWMRSSTSEKATNTASTDTLSLSVLDDGGALLQTLKTHSNLDVDHLLWKRETFDLSAYRGKTIQIQAKSVQDAQHASTFRLDDLGVVLVPPQLGLALTPKQATLLGGSVAPFTAQVTNSSSNQVTWSVTGGSLGQSSTATATATNKWTLPLQSGTFTLNAFLQEDANVKDSAIVQVIADADISLSLAPLTGTLLPGQGLNLVAGGDGGGGVTWSGDPALQVVPNGLQATATLPGTTPLQTRILKVRATSALNPAKFLESTLTVKSMDLNQDGVLDVRDLLALGANWNQGPTSPANLKGAGKVDETDLAALLSQLP